MNQKQIGIIVLIVGVVLVALVFFVNAQDNARVNTIIQETGSCYLSDGTCLHEDRNYAPYIIGWVISAALIMLGLYLMLFDKTQKILAETQVKVASALAESKKKESEDGKMNAFLSGFTEDEQTVLKAIKEQDGIQQSTLRYRTGMSKTALSLMLKNLEERKIITRKESGKTNKVYLRKKF